MTDLPDDLFDRIVELTSGRPGAIELEELVARWPDYEDSIRKSAAALIAAGWMQDCRAAEAREETADRNDTSRPDDTDDFAAGVLARAAEITPAGLHRRIRTSGLLTDQELALLSGSESSSHLLQQLQGVRNLTEWQLDQIVCSTDTRLVIDDYELLNPIGAGGMGEVYRARQRAMDRIVALKLMKAGSRLTPERRARFEREGRVLARLEHPHIIRAWHAGTTDGQCFLAMEYVEGRDLRQVVQEDGPFQLEEAVRLIAQTAEGLAYLHHNGVVHRDIKPSNLLLDSDGNVKITDFGLVSQLVSSDPELTDSATVLGTAAYAAPEQLLSPAATDERSDLYALAGTLCFLLTGEQPLANDQAPPIAARAVARPKPLSERVDGIPPHINRLFQDATNPQPGARPQTADEFARRLRGDVRRPPWKLALVAVVLVLVALLSRERWWPRVEEPEGPSVAGISGESEPTPPSAGNGADSPNATTTSKSDTQDGDAIATNAKPPFRLVRHEEFVNEGCAGLLSAPLRLGDYVRCQLHGPLSHSGFATLSPDPTRRHLCYATSAGLVRIIGLTTLQTQFVLPGPLRTVLATSWSRDGERLLIRSNDGIAELWDVSAQRLVKRYQLREADYAICLHPNGRQVAAARYSEDRGNTVVGLYDLDGAPKRDVLTVKRRPIRMAWSHDARWFLVLTSDGSLTAIDQTSSRVRQAKCTSFKFLSDGDHVYCASRRSHFALRLSDDARFDLPGEVQSLNDGTFLLQHARSLKVLHADFSEARVINRFFSGECVAGQQPGEILVFHPDGSVRRRRPDVPLETVVQAVPRPKFVAANRTGSFAIAHHSSAHIVAADGSVKRVLSDFFARSGCVLQDDESCVALFSTQLQWTPAGDVSAEKRKLASALQEPVAGPTGLLAALDKAGLHVLDDHVRTVFQHRFTYDRRSTTSLHWSNDGRSLGFLDRLEPALRYVNIDTKATTTLIDRFDALNLEPDRLSVSRTGDIYVSTGEEVAVYAPDGSHKTTHLLPSPPFNRQLSNRLLAVLPTADKLLYDVVERGMYVFDPRTGTASHVAHARIPKTGLDVSPAEVSQSTVISLHADHSVRLFNTADLRPVAGFVCTADGELLLYERDGRPSVDLLAVPAARLAHFTLNCQKSDGSVDTFYGAEIQNVVRSGSGAQ